MLNKTTTIDCDGCGVTVTVPHYCPIRLIDGKPITCILTSSLETYKGMALASITRLEAVRANYNTFEGINDVNRSIKREQGIVDAINAEIEFRNKLVSKQDESISDE